VNEYALDNADGMTELMRGFSVREDSGHTIIMAVGEIDAYNASALTATIREQIRRGHHRLVVDLTAVPFVDSSGLGALVGGYKRTRVHADGKFAVISVARRFLDALRITGLVRVLPVYESFSEILQTRDGNAYSHSYSLVSQHYGLPQSQPKSQPQLHSQPRHAGPAAALAVINRPGLACDYQTLRQLAAQGDVDAIVERSLLYGSAGPRGSLIS
jgi:anti-sigma B factor antagonist